MAPKKKKAEIKKKNAMEHKHRMKETCSEVCEQTSDDSQFHLSDEDSNISYLGK
jgi:hypothetical protein